MPTIVTMLYDIRRMENNYHMELAVKYLTHQEQQRKASKTYYENNRERLIKLNLDKINEIRETE